MDLFNATAGEVRQLAEQETNPEVLRALLRLEDAILQDDDIERIEAVGELSDMVLTLGW